MKMLLLFVAITSSSLIFAAPKPLGNVQAPQDGTFYYNLESAPTTLHPLSSTDAYASRVQGYIMDTLAIRDSETYEWVPAMAKSWEISKDGKVFTFALINKKPIPC